MSAGCYLYAFGVPNTIGVVKVGISANPVERLKTVQQLSGNGLIEALVLYRFIDRKHARCAEAYCHASLNFCHAHGEFFQYPLGTKEVAGKIANTLALGGFISVEGTWKKEDGNLKTRHLERPVCQQARTALANPGVRERMSANLRIALADPAVRAQRAKLSRRNWEDPEYRERVIQAMRISLADPAQKARIGEASRRRWEDPEIRRQMSEAQSKALADPAAKARKSEASRRRWEDPEYRKRTSQALRKALADPAAKARRSESMRRVWAEGKRARATFKTGPSPNQGRLFD